MQTLGFTNCSIRAALLVGAATLFVSGQATQPPPQPAPPTPPAQKPGPPVPAGTGGPGGTTEAERMQKFLAIGEAPDPAAVSRGKNLFVATCGFCHGANATGGESGPNLVRSVLVLHDNKGDQIGPVIRNGRAAKGMPAFPSLTPAQITDIAEFLKSRYQAAANRGSYQIQNIITGDAKAGETFFNGEGKCNTCHSVTGDLAGIAKRYEPDALQSKFLYPAARRRGEGGADTQSKRAVPTATVTLASGQTFTGELEHLDDFNVSITDDKGGYHSWSLDNGNVKVSVQDPLAAHLELLKKFTNPEMHNVLAYLETLK
ncbi:MAG: c-type cytochrome [Bryobacteraceae bacterium]